MEDKSPDTPATTDEVDTKKMSKAQLKKHKEKLKKEAAEKDAKEKAEQAQESGDKPTEESKNTSENPFAEEPKYLDKKGKPLKGPALAAAKKQWLTQKQKWEDEKEEREW